MVFMGRGFYLIPLPEGKRRAYLLCSCMQKMQASPKKRFIKMLSPVGSERYRKKLDLVRLRQCPYGLADQEWEDNMTKWPGVVSGIFTILSKGFWKSPLYY